jgi:hypothetical protein
MTVKPLNQLTKHPSNASTVSKAKSGKSFTESPQPVDNKRKHGASIDNYEHHSKHSHTRSKHYKEVVVGNTDTGQYGDKAIAKLNPNSAAPGVRSFPGLAN